MGQVARRADSSWAEGRPRLWDFFRLHLPFLRGEARPQGTAPALSAPLGEAWQGDQGLPCASSFPACSSAKEGGWKYCQDTPRGPPWSRGAVSAQKTCLSCFQIQHPSTTKGGGKNQRKSFLLCLRNILAVISEAWKKSHK